MEMHLMGGEKGRREWRWPCLGWLKEECAWWKGGDEAETEDLSRVEWRMDYDVLVLLVITWGIGLGCVGAGSC